MDARKKLLLCTATFMLAAGAVSAQDYTPYDSRVDASSNYQQFDRIAANDSAPRYTRDVVPEAPAGRFVHRLFPLNDPVNPAIIVSAAAADEIERPVVAHTPDTLIKKPSLD